MCPMSDDGEGEHVIRDAQIVRAEGAVLSAMMTRMTPEYNQRDDDGFWID
jgi:hypothetical protein